jgi:hypothetical protein
VRRGPELRADAAGGVEVNEVATGQRVRYPRRMARIKQSTLTALAACLFIAGVVLLFVVLFHDAIRAGVLMWIAIALLVAAVASWVASARAGG